MDGRLCVCRVSVVGSGEALASLVSGVGASGGDSLFSITRASDELSVVCAEEHAPSGATVESGWRAMKVEGTLDFSMTGILASISAPLAEAGVPVFVVSTYDTDYVLVKEANLGEAVSALGGAGHSVAMSEKSRSTFDT